MHFYYFLCLLVPILRKFSESFPPASDVFASFASFVVLKTRQRKIRSIRSIRCEYILDIPYNSTLSNSTCAHGAQFNTQHSTLNIHLVAQAGARTCCHAFRGGRCAACYPRGPPAAINKKNT